MDSVDKVIWILPFLGVLDVISALYAESLGYSLVPYEIGLSARFFASIGLFYFYIPIYLLIIVGIAYILWYIKNRKLSPSDLFDKVVFLFLVGITCYLYMQLTVAFIGNFFLPYFVDGKISWSSVALLAILSTAFTLAYYLWRDVLTWLKTSENKKKE